MTILQGLLSIASGSLVGFTLGLVGGGGSILAVPLLVYVVGVPSPHVAIGTSAVAVAASAAANLAGHARAKTVKWPCAIVFALAGIAGAAGGAQLGKLVDGGRLLALFGVLMVIIGLAMLRPRKSGGNPDVALTRESMLGLAPLLIAVGFAVGLLSGFFGIGGGFLIVPGLIGATAMPLINAIGSSLVSVTAFGLTTAASYAWAGLVD
ncbi:MAG: sulfite exporter TauE/SafE family protein, partial [Pseudolabrys sp.]